MKFNYCFNRIPKQKHFGMLLVVLLSIGFMVLPSCQEDESYINPANPKIPLLKSSAIDPDLYYGPELFGTVKNTVYTEKVSLANPNFEHYDGNFLLKVQNGNSKSTKVTTLEIKIDGVTVLTLADFAKGSYFAEKALNCLTAESKLEIKIAGPVGSYIGVTIYATLKPNHALITNQGGTFSFLDGRLTLSIPSGALDTSTFISISEISDEMSDGFKVKAPLVFEFKPDGLVFNEPAILTIKFPDEIDLNPSLFLGPYLPDFGCVIWHPSTIDTQNRTLTTSINHFSIWLTFGSKFSPGTYYYWFDRLNLPSNYVGDQSNLLLEISNDIDRAFRKWEAYTKFANIRFTSIPQSNYPTILIKFINSNKLWNQLESAFGCEGVGVVGYGILDDSRMIWLNNDRIWHPTIELSHNNNLGSYNIERILTHEIGHLLGLHDIKEDELVGKYSIMRGEPISYPQSICAHDLENLKSNYPLISNKCEYLTPNRLVKVPLSVNEIYYHPGQIMHNQFSVKVDDNNGIFALGIPDVTAVFQLIERNTNDIVEIDQPVVSSDLNGVITLKELKLPNKCGDYNLQAKIWKENGSCIENYTIKIIDDNNTNIYDGFDNDLSNWILYGSPSPQWISSILGKSGVFDNNGDSNYNSGAISKQTFDVSQGFTLQSEVYLDFTNLYGCWDEVNLGIADQSYQYWGGFNPYISLCLVAQGYGCSGISAYKGHTYLLGGYYSSNGWIPVGTSGDTFTFNADAYNKGWHVIKIVVDNTKIPRFYIDDNLIFTGSIAVADYILSPDARIWLGARSSGSAGKSYHNWVSLTN